MNRKFTYQGVGIMIIGSSGHEIGGTTTNAGNVIAFSGGAGVSVVTDAGAVPGGIRILSNSMFGNQGIGIDLGGDGPTKNDNAPDADKGPNGLQNYPKLTSAAIQNGRTAIAGSLTSQRKTAYLIQVFSGTPSDAEGRNLLGSLTVTTGASGSVDWTLKTSVLASGTPIVATATDVTRRQTSEFSKDIPVQ